MILILLSLGVLVLSLISYDAYVVGQWTDDALYIMLARSLADGGGLWETYWAVPRPHCLAPPIYPLTLVPLQWLAPHNLFLHKLFSTIYLIAALWLLRPLLKQNGRPRWALSILALMALSPEWLGAGVRIMTDAFYVLFASAALLALSSYRNREVQAANLWPASVLIAFAPLVRSVGLTLVLAAVGALALARRYRDALAVLIPSLFVSAMWALRNRSVGCGTLAPTTYFSSPRLWLDTLRSARQYAFVELPQTLVPALGMSVDAPWARHLLGPLLGLGSLALLGVVLVGYASRLRAGRYLLELYTAGYGAVLALFGADCISKRYLVPILPFLWIYVFAGIEALLRVARPWVHRIPHRLQHLALLGIAVLLLVQFAYYDTRPLFDPVRNDIPDVRVGATWIRDRAQPDAIVMVSEARSAAFWSQRKVVRYPGGTDRDLEEAMRRHGVDYVLVTPPLVPFDGPKPELDDYASEVVLPYLDAAPHVSQVFADPEAEVYVYEVR